MTFLSRKLLMLGTVDPFGVETHRLLRPDSKPVVDGGQ
jgi:hypothetical protein